MSGLLRIADGSGSLYFDGCYRGALQSIGLTSYIRGVEFSGGEVFREKGIRTIMRVIRPGETPGILYIKKHRRQSALAFLADLLLFRKPRSPAASEWRAIEGLAAAGIETMCGVAYGERGRFPWRGDSFIVTAGAEGERLEDYVHLLRGKWREKRCIIAAVADCARAMHGAGYNHRDFYLSHLFASRVGGTVRIALIDLQRVQRRARGFNRWVVKDIAALNYSSPSPVVTLADRVRFLHRYLGLRRLGAGERRFARKIAMKTEKIRRHDMRRAGRGFPLL